MAIKESFNFYGPQGMCISFDDILGIFSREFGFYLMLDCPKLSFVFITLHWSLNKLQVLDSEVLLPPDFYMPSVVKSTRSENICRTSSGKKWDAIFAPGISLPLPWPLASRPRDSATPVGLPPPLFLHRSRPASFALPTPQLSPPGRVYTCITAVRSVMQALFSEHAKLNRLAELSASFSGQRSTNGTGAPRQLPLQARGPRAAPGGAPPHAPLIPRSICHCLQQSCSTRRPQPLPAWNQETTCSRLEDLPHGVCSVTRNANLCCTCTRYSGLRKKIGTPTTSVANWFHLCAKIITEIGSF
ncbi:hypothetical protein BS78_04G130000 [Paspalum vaginatum]|nr:hypothetical protein BS78_04G130000 [Paspalum vaginatum]